MNGNISRATTKNRQIGIRKCQGTDTNFHELPKFDDAKMISEEKATKFSKHLYHKIRIATTFNETSHLSLSRPFLYDSFWTVSSESPLATNNPTRNYIFTLRTYNKLLSTDTKLGLFDMCYSDALRKPFIIHRLGRF